MNERVERCFVATLLIASLFVQPLMQAAPARPVAHTEKEVWYYNTYQAPRGAKKLKIDWSVTPGGGSDRTWDCDQTERVWSYFPETFEVDVTDAADNLLSNFGTTVLPYVTTGYCTEPYNGGNPAPPPEPHAGETQVISIGHRTATTDATVYLDTLLTYEPVQQVSATPQSGCYSGGAARSEGTIEFSFSRFPTCGATSNPAPSVAVKKTARDHADLTVAYSFPAGTTERALIVRLLPWTDAKGRGDSGSLVKAWSADDAELASNGPFTVTNVGLPSDDRQARFSVEASFFDETNECESVQTGYGAVDCDTCNETVAGAVSAVDGNVRYRDTDPLPPLLDRALVRAFNSGQGRDGFFGVGWSTMFDQVINIESSQAGPELIHFTTPENEQVAFQGDGKQIWPAGISVPGTLIYDGGTNSYAYRPAGARYETLFDPDEGFFAGLRDVATGRTLTVTRNLDVTNALTSMTAVDSWTGATWTMTVQDNMVESISTSAGTWTYDYDEDGLLLGVDGPDGTWRTYVYDANGMTGAHDAAGKLIESHEYDEAGRATSSSQASDEIANITYDLPGPADGQTITRVTSGGGAVTDFVLAPAAGGYRILKRSGGCSTCGTRNEVLVHDARGRVTRRQDAAGYITTNTYDGSYLASTTTYLKPSNCDPATSSTQCRLQPDTLASAELEPTEASTTTAFTYGDPHWPDKPTQTTVESVHSTGEFRVETTTYDEDSGEALVRATTGWTGDADPTQVTHSTAMDYYDGTEGAVFDPGNSFPTTLAQPKLLKSVNGPRTDVTDTTAYVYYPVHASVTARLRGRLAAVKNAAGHITRIEDYDWFGNATRIVDPNGVVRELSTDAIGRTLTEKTVALSSCDTAADPLCDDDVMASRTYDDLGPLTTIARPTGGVTVYDYDDRGRLFTISRGPSTSDLQEQIETIYDEESGQKSRERHLARVGGSWVEKRRESYAYDDEGRLSTVTHADASTVAYAYDAAGRLTSVRDENHATPNTFYTYDPAGRIASVSQTLDGAPDDTITTSYAYDRYGDLVQVVDPNGNETAYRYDDFGRLLRQDSPVTGTTTYGYDPAGNLLLTTDGNGAETTRTYDAIGRLESQIAERDNESETVAYTYDTGTLGLGRLTTMTDPTGETEYLYDRRGLLLREERTIASSSYATSFQYDADGNRSRVVYPSTAVVDYTFDYAGRASSVSRGATSVVTSASYLPFGPATTLAFGNGTTRNATYDTRYLPSTNILVGPGGTIASYSYAHDAVANTTEIHDDVDSGYDRDFVYDDLNRLTGVVSGSSLWGNGEYEYDAMGSQQSSYLGAGISRHYSFNDSTPRISQVVDASGAQDVTYDAAGNELGVGQISNAYSPRNLLSIAGAVQYGYDGRGVRTTSVESAGIVALSVPDPVIGAGRTVQGTIRISAPAPIGGMTISLSSSSTALSVPSNVIVAGGEIEATFEATAAYPVEDEDVTLSATTGLSTRQAELVIQRLRLDSLSLDTPVGGGGDASGCVALNGLAGAGGFSIDLASSESTVTVPATATVASGEESACFDITTPAVEESFVATITASAEETELEAELEILPPVVAELLFEGDIATGGSTTGTIVLFAPAPVGGAAVALTADVENVLSLPSSVTVPAGETEATFTVSAAATMPYLTTVMVTASYFDPNYDYATPVNLLPPAITGLSITPSTVEGGQNVTAEVTLAAPAAPGTEVYVDSTQGFPYGQTIVMDEGETATEQDLLTSPVPMTRSAVVTAELEPTNATANLTIEPLALTLDSLSLSPSSVTGSQDATLTVTLTEAAEAGGLEVEIWGGSNIVEPPPFVVVPQGQTSVDVPIETAVVDEDQEVSISGRHVVTRRSVDLTVLAPTGTHVVSVMPASDLPVGGDIVSVTVTLDEAAPSGDAEVALVSSNTAIGTVPSSVIVTQGNTSASFDLDTDAVTEASDLVVDATYGGVTRAARLTVLPASGTLHLASISLPDTVRAGQNAVGTLTLSGAAPSGGTDVTLSGSRPGIATAPSTVTVPQGSSSADFTLTTQVSEQSRDLVLVASLASVTRADRIQILPQTPELRRQPGGAQASARARVSHRLQSHRVVVRAGARGDARIAGGQPAVATTVEGPNQRYYLYTPELTLLAETTLTPDTTPAIETEYIWFGGQPVAQVDTSTDEIAWYFDDHLGTPILQTDSSANVIWRVEREPYGKLFSTRVGASRHQPLSFPGQEERGELSYNIFRWYRAGWGRYTQPDPIGVQGGENLYAYAEGRPVAVVDLIGLSPVNPEYCKRLLERIQNLQKKIDERTGELQEDPLGLSETAPGDDVLPSLSRRGHRRLINVDKAQLAARKAEYLANCRCDPPNGAPAGDGFGKYFSREHWEEVTGLTGFALVAYLVVSELSRLYPPRNLVPVP